MQIGLSEQSAHLASDLRSALQPAASTDLLTPDQLNILVGGAGGGLPNAQAGTQLVNASQLHDL